VQHAGVVLGGVLGLAGHAYRSCAVDDGAAPEPLALDTNYLAVTGACLMVARDRFDEVGGLDETFAVAFNDVDLCLKLRRAGYRNVVVPSARLYHYESKSRGRDDTREKQARAFAESEELRRRWPEWSVLDPYYNPNLTLDAEDSSVRL
jgi:GT2 family glycosyltransferase